VPTCFARLLVLSDTGTHVCRVSVTFGMICRVSLILHASCCPAAGVFRQICLSVSLSLSYRAHWTQAETFATTMAPAHVLGIAADLLGVKKSLLPPVAGLCGVLLPDICYTVL
jgi:hypothetical protein